MSNPGNQPQFKIMSGALKAFTRKDAEGNQRRFLSCTASSSIKDLHDDEFTPECVSKMADSALSKSMTIFLNHQYKVPEDVFGSTTNSRSVVRMGMEGPITDMDLEVMLNETNPRAVATYDAIESGVKLGVSIGAIVKSWHSRDPKDKWGETGMVIDDVELLEASIVGIPANPRSWVQNAIKAIKSVPADGEDAVAQYTAPEDQSIAMSNQQEEGEQDVLDLLDNVINEKSADTVGGDPTEDDTDEVTKAGCPECGGAAGSPKDGCDCNYHRKNDASEKSAADTDPDEEPTEPEVTSSDKDAGLPDDGVALKSLDILIRTYTDQIAVLEKQLSLVTKERDDANQGLLIATDIIDKIASLPLGRKTSFQRTVGEFKARLSGVYDDEFIKFLERNHE